MIWQPATPLPTSSWWTNAADLPSDAVRVLVEAKVAVQPPAALTFTVPGLGTVVLAVPLVVWDTVATASAVDETAAM